MCLLHDIDKLFIDTLNREILYLSNINIEWVMHFI